MAHDFPLVLGVDGGATEVKVHAVACDDLRHPSSFTLRPEHAARRYALTAGFTPVPIREQLAQRSAGHASFTATEREAGRAWIAAAADAIAEVARTAGHPPVLIGIGMPGLKTTDRRGIDAVNHGPRIPDYLDALTAALAAHGVALAAPIDRLGSDADYCGLGEEHGAGGLFRDVANAYYAGCGTGIADALKLHGQLVPFDHAAAWTQKAWQIPSTAGPTFEQLVSAQALNHAYATRSGVQPPPFPEDAALHGDLHALTCLDHAAHHLAELFFERLWTTKNGRAPTPRRTAAYQQLDPQHPYRGTVLDRLVLGQRLGFVYADPRYRPHFGDRLDAYLAERIAISGDAELSAACLAPPTPAANPPRLRPGFLAGSRLRAAPALGAAIAAAHAWQRPAAEFRISPSQPTAEPTIRVGIILAEDRDRVVSLRLPDHQFELISAEHRSRLRAANLEIACDNEILQLRVPGAPPLRTGCVTLRPLHEPPLHRGAGVQVHHVRAGRGFHWQTRADLWLPGTLELHPRAGYILLVNIVPLETYLAGVITAEMNGTCPAALMEAQCIVARSWTLAHTERKHPDAPFTHCHDDCCQRYHGSTNLTPAALAAVQTTRGQLLLAPDHTVLDANYAKCCGGVTELPIHVWGSAKPGLTSVFDAPPGPAANRFMPVTDDNLDAYLAADWSHDAHVHCSPHVVPIDAVAQYLGRFDQPDHYFRWHTTQPAETLIPQLAARHPSLASLDALLGLRVTRRGVSGRASRLEITGLGTTGETITASLDTEYAIRAALHPRFLYSSAFTLELKHAPDRHILEVSLRGAGWGHGVGLCQIGALGLALQGATATAICHHYYPHAHHQRAYA